jgi:hypothetical protein
LIIGDNSDAANVACETQSKVSEEFHLNSNIVKSYSFLFTFSILVKFFEILDPERVLERGPNNISLLPHYL